MATVETQLNESLSTMASGVTLDLRAHIVEVRKQIDSLFLDLAKGLSEIYHKEYYVDWGYKTFESYVIGELDYSYRKAKYLVEVWDHVKNTELDISRIEAVGWTKMSNIARIMNDDNAELWLEKAEKLTVRDLNVEVKQVIDSSIPDTRPKVTYMKFRLDSVDASIINEAITESSRINDTPDVALALAQICDEWLLSKGTLPKATSLEEHIQFLNKVFGVTLMLAPTQANIEAVEREAAAFDFDFQKDPLPIKDDLPIDIPEEPIPVDDSPPIEFAKIEGVVEDEEDLLLSDADINAMLAE